MRRLLAVLVPLALLAACGGDEETAVDVTTTSTAPVSEAAEDADEDQERDAPEASTSTTAEPDPDVPTDSPAGDGPAAGDEDDEGLGDALLVADLDGASEVPGPGHPDATGRFEAELSDGRLCVDMIVSGLREPVTGAHLHDGGAGEAGSVTVDIGTPPDAAADPARWTDACSEVDDEVIERIAGSPERVYVNVHTASHPDGAVRGQLAVASVFDRTLDD